MLTVLTILGSLGLFIFGMKVMSEGLQKASGSKLRSMTQDLAKTPARGVLSGALMTTIVQSSSASTVIMVSFVNAGLLNLRQAISMIMGANLGTTTTFWLIALVGFKLNLSSIALPAVGFGVVCLFMRYAKVREIGETLIGFGILFLGLNLLKDAVPDVESNVELFEALSSFGKYGFFSVLLFFFFGIILTIAVQSSSVAGAITLTMVAKGWIDYELAAAIVLGENVGTTITANLAAITGNTEAKRAARAHLIFNLIGVLWILPVFYFYLGLVEWLTAFISLSDRGTTELKLAVFHSLFNLINTGVLIAFIPQLAKLATRMVKSATGGIERNRFIMNNRTLGENLPRTGEILLGEAQRGVGQLNKVTQNMFLAFLDMYAHPGEMLDARAKAMKAHLEEGTQMADDISECLIQCASREVSQKRTLEITALLRVISELEEIMNCCNKLGTLAKKKYSKQRVLPEETQDELAKFGSLVDQFLNFQARFIDRPVSAGEMETAIDLEKQIDRSRKRLRKEAVRRMSDPANIKSEMLFIDILNTIEGIGDHCLNILRLLRNRD